MSRDQAPAGGCVNCGASVRTRKDGEWLCANCHRAAKAKWEKWPEAAAKELERAGKAWAKAKEREREAAAACYAAIVTAVERGLSEVSAAELAGVDRMTVRRALGKL